MTKSFRPLVAGMIAAVSVVGAGAGPESGTAPIRFEYARIPFTLEHCETPSRYAPETMAGGVAVFDYNNDGLPDIFFTNGAEMPSLVKTGPKYSNRLFRNDGHGHFTDVTAQSGVAGEGYATGVAVADYDNDGYEDLFVAGVHRYTLYHNNGDGTFTDVTQKAGISAADREFGPLWGVGAAWFDYNRDGRLDLFVVNYMRWDPKKEPKCPDYCHPNYYEGSPNRLYRNDGNGHFTDVSAATGIRAYVGKGMSASVAGLDGGGRLSIFVPNDKQMNFLFRDAGGGKFEDQAMEFGVALPFSAKYVSGMGSDFRDMDNDGLPDIFFVALADETFPLFRNSGKGYFKDVAPASGLAQLAMAMSGYSPGIRDFDNDGWKDLFVSGGHVQSLSLTKNMKIDEHNAVFRNLGTGKWAAQDAGFSAAPPRRHRGAAFGDFDGDGRTDIVVTALGAEAEIWLNRSPAEAHWLDVKLTGTVSNRDGIGAVVTVTTADGKQWNHASSAVGYASSSAGPVHFGVGKHVSVDLIEVRWPSGRTQRLTNVKADCIVNVREAP